MSDTAANARELARIIVSLEPGQPLRALLGDSICNAAILRFETGARTYEALPPSNGRNHAIVAIRSLADAAINLAAALMDVKPDSADDRRLRNAMRYLSFAAEWTQLTAEQAEPGKRYIDQVADRRISSEIGHHAMTCDECAGRLNDCPFCGIGDEGDTDSGLAIVGNEDSTKQRVECPCGVCGPWFKTDSEMRAHWNERQP